VHYEQAGHRAHADLFSPMYLPIEHSEAYCRSEEKKPLDQQRPLIQCEYNHAMGNSSGNLADYWQLVRRERLFQGGFIWDWKDQSIIHRKHGLSAAEDRSANKLPVRLLGSLDKDEGLFGGSAVIGLDPKLDLTGPLTLVAEARLNQTYGAPGGQPIISKGDTAYSLKINEGGDLEFFIYTITGWQNVTAKLPATATSRFHTYAGIFDGNQLAIAIDGAIAATKPASGPVALNAYELAVGIDTEETGRRLRGSVRRAAVYNRALTPVELAAAADPLVLLEFTQDAAKEATDEFLAYGGDFNERPTDYSFCCNGIVMGDLSPSPQFEEVKKAYQNIHTSLVDGTTPDVKVRVHNENFFRSIQPIQGSWKLLKDGLAVAEGKLNLPDIAAGQSAELTVATGSQPEPGSEYVLRTRYDLAEKTEWHPAGMPVAWDEMPLPWGKRTVPAPTASDTAAGFSEDDAAVTAQTKDLAVVVDKKTGAVRSIRHKEQEWLLSPLQLNFWRPATNNDEGAKLHHALKAWQHAGARSTATSVSARREGNDVLITAELKIPVADSGATVTYRITGGGQLAVETSFRPSKDAPELPRIGYQARISNRTPMCKWHGRGPHENYVDRNTGAWTAVHELSVPEMFHRYTDPQESGQRTDIRWLSLRNPLGGSALKVDATGEHLLEMGLYPCSPEDISLAMHPTEIPEREFFTLNIDHRQAGVGGTNSWGARALPTYRLFPDKTYQWSFLMTFEETPALPQLRRPAVLPPELIEQLEAQQKEAEKANPPAKPAGE
jgi:beta-galactosidase